jgi:hypothetical protein
MEDSDYKLNYGGNCFNHEWKIIKVVIEKKDVGRIFLRCRKCKQTITHGKICIEGLTFDKSVEVIKPENTIRLLDIGKHILQNFPIKNEEIEPLAGKAFNVFDKYPTGEVLIEARVLANLLYHYINKGE